MSPLSQSLAAAVEHHRAGRFHEAELIYRQILQADPRHADALHLLGLIAHEARRFDAAIRLIGQAIAVNPNVPSYHCNLGMAYQAAGDPARAVETFRQALRLKADYAEAHNNLGAVLKAQGRLDEAAASFREAVRVRPDLAEAHYNLGVALHQLGDRDGAVAHLQTCLRLRPDYAPASAHLRQILPGLPATSTPVVSAEEYFHRATEFLQQGRLDEAAAEYRRGLQINPRSPAACNNLGNALQELGRLDEAVAAYRQALALRPDYADAHNNLGNTLQRGNRLDEAEACYRRALEAQPDHLAAHGNLGVLFKDQGRLDEAAIHLRAALAQRPSGVLRVLLATLLPPVYASMDDLRERRRRLEGELRALHDERLTFDLTREVVPNLFYLAYQGCNDRDIQRDLAQLYAAGMDATAPAGRAAGTGGKIQLGVLSKYLKDHTIGTLMRGLFATLSRDAFAVTALVFDGVRDPVTEFIRRHADRYVVLPDNLAVARRTVAGLGLDVLFYADIGMDPLTYSLAFSRLAPVQCVTWGHPVTTGIPTVDYFLSSELAEPPDAADHYTETLVRLKSLPFYYYRPAPPSPLKGRDHFGLSDAHHLYGCPQTLFKFHPEFDALLGGILRRDPLGQVVLIKGKHRHWEDLLLKRFTTTLPDVLDRIRWLPPQPRSDFLNLMAACDVLLDTIYFSGGNTSYEGLALGVPIVTLPAPLMRGRLTCALYKKMGVMDCVTASPEEYIELAVALGTDPSRREAVRAKILAANGVLFEDIAAVHELEEFFQKVVARARPS